MKYYLFYYKDDESIAEFDDDVTIEEVKEEFEDWKYYIAHEGFYECDKDGYPL